jgi:membrane-bound lytic murein transglycosylase B
VMLLSGIAAVWMAAAPTYDAKQPSSWHLSAKVAKGSDVRKALVADWMVKSDTPGEKALTEAEANALLDDPRAELIYGDKTVSIVAPSMLVRQRQQHIDLLKEFLTPDYLALGVKFCAEHRHALDAAREHHGVDPSVVVSVLMWESKLGIETVKYAAFNAFTSQTFFADEANAVALSQAGETQRIDPEKQKERVGTIRERARKNLRALVRACKARGMDALAVKGSWAGALGYPQFMPASLRWTEDGDGDGKIDLYNFDDSIASIARYLADHRYATSRENAVFSYNHEGAYVHGVLAWADALTARLQAPPPEIDAGTAAVDAGL